jgi:ADP-heptose:LPS heptosyltransferase
MEPLLANLPGVTQYCHKWNDVPGHAVHCRLSSLPHIFNTTPDTIPAQVPYMRADPARVGVWRDRLDATLPRHPKRIGLAWTGRPTHPNDRRRSVRLSRLLPLIEAGQATFVSLQKQVPDADRETMSAFAGMTDLSNDLTDFGETAALIENLDLVITVDTAMGHLAGAMAKPVWIMVPKASDWRWMLDRDDSPWYPTARLFRQAKPGEWDPVLSRVTDALAVELRQPALAI